jgi:mannose-6-phosphate isomerase-like protein (cupin superfamily)
LNTPDLSVIQECIPAGLGEVKHSHHRARQLFYVLQGRLEIEAGDETVQLERGDSFEIPPGVEHRVRNPFREETILLVISAPSTQGDRVNLE